MKLDAKKLIEERLAVSMGFNKYDVIVHQAWTTDLTANADFQRTFNGFYMVRRNAEWRKVYYDLFESMKGKTATFAEIITTLFQETGNIEASFSSKMLATLYPEKPIWDQYVLQNLDLKLEGKTKQEKLDNAIAIYTAIEKWYVDYLVTDNAKDCIAVFDKILHRYNWLSDVKKIDFFLWSLRKDQ